MRIITKGSVEVKKLKAILKELNIRHCFCWTDYRLAESGHSEVHKNRIVVYGLKPDFHYIKETGKLKITTKSVPCDEFLSTVFHEMQHILCARKNIFLDYNQGFNKKKASQTYYNRWASQMLAAERLCDKRAKAHMKQVFPKLTFVDSYTGWRGRWLEKFALKEVADAFEFKVWKRKNK